MLQKLPGVRVNETPNMSDDREKVNDLGNFIMMTIYYNCILNKTVVHLHIMHHDYDGSIIVSVVLLFNFICLYERNRYVKFRELLE